MKPFEKNIKVLTGPKNSGKSYAAKIMKLAFKKPFHLLPDSSDRDFFKMRFLLDGLDNSHDVILIDDLKLSDLERVLQIFTQPYLRVEGKFKTPVILDTPRIIITLNDASESDLKVLAAPYIERRIDVLKCYIFDNGLVEVEKVELETPELAQQV